MTEQPIIQPHPADRPIDRMFRRLGKLEGQNGFLWLGSGIWALLTDGIKTTAAFSWLADHGGDLWAWVWVLIGLVQLVSCVLNRYGLRLVVGFLSSQSSSSSTYTQSP